MKEFLCKLILSCTLAGPGAKPVEELTYGTLLFEYFQADYSQALVTAMVAKAQDRRGIDPVRFELAAGSFAFSSGMFKTAADTFDAIDPAELQPIDQQRLAFHLAREYHRRSDWNALEPQLTAIQLGENWRGKVIAHPEVEYMRADLATERDQFAQAQAALALIPADNAFRAYGLFNLGVAQKDRDAEAAVAAFTELAQMKATDAESFDLVQRAKLALAFLANQQQSQADAAQVLAQLPANGRYRDTAMAAYGSLAMGQGDYELAARIWLTLKEQPYWTPSTAAARLGFPLSLENLASSKMALQHYRRAESTFESRLAALTSISARAQDPAWVRELLATFSAPEAAPELDASAQAQQMLRWQEELGHTDWLEWLASDTVHGLLSDWRTLLSEQTWLEAVPANLAALEQVATERRRRGAKAKHLLYENELLDQRHALNAALLGLQDSLNQLTHVAPNLDWSWMQELATPKERATLTRLQGMSELIDQHFSPKDKSKWQARITRLRGVMLWEQTTSHATRLQALRQQVVAAQHLLADVDERLVRVQSAEADFAAGVETDFHLLADRVGLVRAEVAAAIADREERLAGEIRRGMRQEMRQVQQYLLVTRVAIARTSDQLAMAAGAPSSVRQ